VTAGSRRPAPEYTLRTERLVLRAWRDEDLPPFAELNADPVVMEHFPSTLRREDSDFMVERIGARFAETGLYLWAVEVPGAEPFIGFVGLNAPSFEAAFTPCVEVGWRLSQAAWGKGYASEAARAAVTDGFERLGLAEIVSFTTTTNIRSQRVMQRLGMTRDPADDFDHPNLPPEHPLRRHVLYRLARPPEPERTATVDPAIEDERTRVGRSLLSDPVHPHAGAPHERP
jgi:ribosomal-protein-alanine N-acetyltransferase